MLDPMPTYRTLSVMPTYQCTAACQHCGTYSHPKEKTRLPEEMLISGIDQAVASGYKLIVFTGGEPTLAGPILLRAIERAARSSVMTRVVTNAWWATSDAAADRKIRELTVAGLREINFSTGDEHAKYVPLENVLRAARAAARAKLSGICIMVELVNERRISKATLESHPIYQSIQKEIPCAGIRILESPWMPLVPDAISHYPNGLAVNASNLATRTGCNSCLTTTTLQADGRLAACCGLGMRRIPELQMGNIESMRLAEADEIAENDFLKRWIRVEGPEKILAWAASHDSSIAWENMYAHRCQACIRIYKDPKVRAVVQDHHMEKIADVVFAEWLLYQFRDADDNNSQKSDAEGEAVANFI